MPGERAGPAVSDGARAGRGPRSVPQRPADPGPADARRGSGLSKWARRRPACAAAVAGAARLLSFLLLGGGIYYNHRLREETRCRADAPSEQAAVDARAAFDQRNLALKTLKQLIYDVQERLAQTPATRSLRRSLLDTAIRGLEEIERSTAGASPDLSQAVAYQKLGDIYRVIGQSRRRAAPLRPVARGSPAALPRRRARRSRDPWRSSTRPTWGSA